MTVERLVERGNAMVAWLEAGGSVNRLATLDRRVRRGERSDWPHRPWADERRQGVPDLDLADWQAGRV